VSLKQQKLIEFIKCMMEQLIGLLRSIVNLSIDEDIHNPKTSVLLVIRLNDLTNMAKDFAKFKDTSVECVGHEFQDRLEVVFDKYFRDIVDSANS
jgi:hypothetical protein